MRHSMWPCAVVACKTEDGIVRAITSYTSLREMVEAIVRQVGMRNLAGTEWTGYTYGLPTYAIGYTSPPGGVYLWKWHRPPDPDGPKYRGDGSHLGITVSDPVLLDVPRGWATSGRVGEWSLQTLPAAPVEGQQTP